MEALFGQLLALLHTLWWPFCRSLALFSAAPVIGENMLPVPIRVLLSLLVAVIMLPVVGTSAHIDPFSMAGLLATGEQLLIGFVIGLAFHQLMAILAILGYLVSSQMGLSMAVMNDPMNGTSSDVISSLLYMLGVIVFFSIDGHLVLTGVLAESFHAWPVGHGFDFLALRTLALNIAWVFAAALLLAIPIIFSTLVVQVGLGFLNRVAPALNLYALGFSLITLFGLYMLVRIVGFVPEHYVRMTSQVLRLLHHDMGL